MFGAVYPRCCCAINQTNKQYNSVCSFKFKLYTSGYRRKSEICHFFSQETEKQFKDELIAKANVVLLYEDAEVQNLAIEKIPIDYLSAKASARAKAFSGKDSAVDENDFFILELLRWFKFEFFTWVDVPKCEQCNGTPERRGMATPSMEDQYWGAGKVEDYYCQNCQVAIRFPRYNHPRKLLETRRGRCGEWSNCFTLLCRSLGYDARLVVEWGDHVWTEVYSHSQKRWLHCDPCENICDAPLMYEIGWKKKIAYAIAFSKDEVQDVTWRYCTNYESVLRRRNLCREAWLLDKILSITNQLQKNLPNERKHELLLQKINELAGFLTAPKQSKDSEAVGRTSGSQTWREARGECQPYLPQAAHTISLTPKEIERKHFCLKYSCATNKYLRTFDNEFVECGWDELTHYHKDIFRKEETDWNMAYLARKEGCAEGIISWKFDFKNSGLTVDNVNIYITSNTFENGEVNVFLSHNDCTIPIKDHVYKGKGLAGIQEFLLTAKLAGGKGNVAWQHAQLFRQRLDSNDCYFSVEITFMEES